MSSNTLLKFSPGKGNAKLASLGGVVYTFSIPSGWTCPFAKGCFAKVVEANGTTRIELGKDSRFKCFSANQENAFPAVRAQRQYNFDLLKRFKTSAMDMAVLINDSLPGDATVIRIHVGGDFFNEDYMAAWVIVALLNPEITFYAYTKSINYWLSLRSEIPDNFKLTASKDGKFDHLIDQNGLKYAEVVFSEEEAQTKGLEIDHDDTHAFMQDKPFALLLHGNQPKGTLAAEALKKLAGKGSYGKSKKV